jgi:hypothetical protein
MRTRIDEPIIDWYVIAAAAVLTFAAAIRFRGLDVSLFEDEVWAAELIRRGGYHPHSYNIAPLFYAIERMWTALRGASVVALREPAAFFGVAASAIALLLHRDRVTAFVWAALLTFSSPLIFYSGRIKQYTLEAAAVTAMIVLLLRALDSRSRAAWFAFFAVALVAVTTLHGPIFVVCGAAVAAFPRARRSAIGFLLLFAAFGAAYFFYLAPGPETAKLHGDMNAWFAQTGRWIDSPRTFFAGSMHWSGQAMNLVRFWWLALALLAVVWVAMRRDFAVVALAIVPPLLIAAASALHLYPYGEVRLMIVCFPAFYLLIADAVSAATRRLPVALLLVVPFIVAGVAGDTYNRTYMHVYDCLPLFEAVAASHDAGEPIYADPSLGAPLRFYHPELAKDLRAPAAAAARGWPLRRGSGETRGSVAIIRVGEATAVRWR